MNILHAGPDGPAVRCPRKRGELHTDRERLLGDEHPDALRARANLAGSYWRAGRTSDAITLQEAVLADSQRVLGAEHPDTLRARPNLAHMVDRRTVR